MWDGQRDSGEMRICKLGGSTSWVGTIADAVDENPAV